MTRRVIVLASAKGSPGVTTTALGVASRWVKDDGSDAILLAEADAAGGDLSAWLGSSDTPGFLDMAASTRLGPAHDSLAMSSQLLQNGVALVPAPAASGQCRAALDMLNQHGSLRVLRGPASATGVVFADIGRMDPSTAGFVATTDVVLLACRGGVDSLSHAAVEIELLRTAGCWLGLIVVGPCSFPIPEVARTLGLGWVHALPWDPSATRTAISAARRQRGRSRSSRWSDSIDALSEDIRRRLEMGVPAAPDPPPPSDHTPTASPSMGGESWRP